MNSSDRKVSSTSSGGGGAAGGGGGSVLSSSSNGQARRFALSPSSFLEIRKDDITAWSVDGASDAIVNAANERMLGGGGVDGELLSFQLHVIHTVGPVYDVDDQPENYLSSEFRYPLKEASKIAISVVKEFSNDFKEKIAGNNE
ncbi:hypothetical protein QJS10_CPB21g01577 [Acorus calamus]|uniref:Macro domain-containing protein n=1 Tax=Acorus calamus TaxID=4465 RepID=A0AAV9C7D9_ACOCL|nr:hypothetical protein QJS10_CPB21g01577 [Acorus calamus]